jgi:hypothetical protein
LRRASPAATHPLYNYQNPVILNEAKRSEESQYILVDFNLRKGIH